MNKATVADEPVIFNCSWTTVQSEVIYWAREILGSNFENNIIYDGEIIPEYANEYEVLGTDIRVKDTKAQRIKCGLAYDSRAMHANLIVLGRCKKPLSGSLIASFS